MSKAFVVALSLAAGALVATAPAGAVPAPTSGATTTGSAPHPTNLRKDAGPSAPKAGQPSASPASAASGKAKTKPKSPR